MGDPQDAKAAVHRQLWRMTRVHGRGGRPLQREYRRQTTATRSPVVDALQVDNAHRRDRRDRQRRVERRVGRQWGWNEWLKE